MAGIDDRARELNARLARADDEDDEDQADEEESEDAADEGIAEQDDEPDEDEDTRGPRTRAAAEGGPALSAGLVLGFLAYAAAIQIVRGGTAQLSGWIKAKLINEPWQPPGGGG